MSRLDETFDALGPDEKAMGLFLTDGFPNPDATVPLLHAIDRGGADFIELGMPFSDPLAEGRPIQRASARALSHGVTLPDTLQTVESFREDSDTPLLLMGYVNPVFKYGVDAFCRDAAEAGVDGLILPDLPPQESDALCDAAAAHGLELVFLIAPNTSDERIRVVDERATGFVYAVSVTGLTGSDLAETPSVDEYLMHARDFVAQNPLLVGFGIKTHDDAMELSRHTDGFIVGSALINRVEALWEDPERSTTDRLDTVEGFARHLKSGTPVPTPQPNPA
ncbi:tryptophan synthase subunit alpha [Salinibacter ruber]|uniref:tryptophan synthase subunit alpha n=1 Tax=Salinibacter ruber TaxID=146919 RepID=UPI000C9F4F17|nr:tryptophan synthase subunit alpha [Salinibacter ruber]MBB4090081.1 tryptophan synthase alpha chain [Salinibacter ruber]MCS3611591.1 tryptophan synthase alpha chain [Salinibacter ruber]MCS3646764.1 tryptophan synthase alpha chain [Salinibacter ruber]MCS3674668.1 tryptophan synthase alpha chain [Salinibacter ruber]MCS3784403.1 tryptophan synthase alpha chain [Salinibacter ruber]